MCYPPESYYDTLTIRQQICSIFGIIFDPTFMLTCLIGIVILTVVLSIFL
jgi:hypothetical protein